MVGHGIHVFVNTRKVKLDSNRITGRELLRLAGYSEGEHWDIYRLGNEDDTDGGTLLSSEDTLEIEDGDWFRVVQGHRSYEPQIK